MKRLLSILLCLCMVFALAACGGETPKDESSTPSTEQTSKPDSTDEKDTTSGTEEPVGDKYDSYAKVGGESIYVNYKDGRRDDTGASSIVFHSTATDLTVLAYDTTGSFSGDHTGVLSMINDGRMLKDIAIYSDADFNDYNTTYKINVKSSEDATVNGIAMVKFTGSVKSTNDRDCYVYGYAFVVDGVPCVLAGFVLSEAQEQNLITSINTEIDTMIKTVRTER